MSVALSADCGPAHQINSNKLAKGLNMTVKTVVYQALEAGPALTILGAVHGNERCGPEAIRRLIAALDAGEAALRRGTLQMMPVVNPKAYAQNVRFVERNLNRQLYPKDEKQHYEDHLDPIVCGLLDRTDVLLDLHSGRLFGHGGVLVVDLAAISLLVVALTGVYMFFKFKRGGPRRAPAAKTPI